MKHLKLLQSLLVILRNLAFYVGLAPMTIVFAGFSMLSWLMPRRWRYACITLWSRFFIAWAQYTLQLRYQVSHLERLPRTACVVVLNHQSMWETIFMQCLLPQQTWILKRELLWIPFFGWGLAALQPIAINRQQKHAATQVVQQGIRALQQQLYVVCYPEGTRAPAGVVLPFKRTAAALAIAAGVPVVPIAHNAGTFWPRGWWIYGAGTIRVLVGPPIATEQQTSAAVTAAAQAWIERAFSS
jgi:1-acyl-sn-glycerol-3-phosphate acyltransferase